MSIGLLYERSETDEIGIKLTAEELNIDIEYIPFRKISVSIDENGYSVRSKGKDHSHAIKDVVAILNRTQSKNRRLFATYLMEAFGKHVINPYSVESVCYSKLRTLLHFWRAGIKIPKTVYVPCDSHERVRDGTEIHNEGDIADLLQQELGNAEIVLKPDAGTHGRMVNLAKNREELLRNIQRTNSSIINPVGILAQELVQKWFYDLRIIVTKEKGKAPYCHPKALARAGFKDFRTNTFLGNLVFDAALTPHIRNQAVKCGNTIGKDNEAWLLALDAMVAVGNNKVVDDEFVISQLDKLSMPFDVVKKVKMDKTKKMDFANWNRKLEEAFQDYKSAGAYQIVKEVIDETVEKNQHSIIFHEANSCPEFWEQTRLITDLNLAIPLLKSAQSLADSGY